MKKLFSLTVLFIFFLSVLLSCDLNRQKIYKDSRISMDTVVTISVVSESADNAQTAIDKAFEEIEKLSSLINFYSDKSELALINKNAGKNPVHVSRETLDITKEAITVSEQTEGAFDPSTGVITVLWDFHKKIKPDRKTINKVLKLVSFKNIIIDENKETVFLKKKGMMIDLGGIAKGHAADKAVDILSSSGIKAALVSVAGDIRAYGLKPDGKPWMIGIKDPRPVSASEDILGALPLKDMAISTSGDYQRFFEVEGIRYHHILDPRSGMPASGCQSVSVIAEKATIADALSTAVFVLGPEKGLDLLERLGYDGIIVDYYGKFYITEGINDTIEIKRVDT